MPNNNFESSNEFKNAERPFVELFSLLNRYECLSKKGSLDYKTCELKAISQQADNAIDLLLQGLQDLGQLIGFAANNKQEIKEELGNIGFFISAITNLTEALNVLRLDTEYLLKERGVEV